MRFPLKDKPESSLTLQIAAGQVNKDSAAIMEMTYNTQREILMESSEVLGILESSHDTLHNVFEMITKPIKSRMQPVVNGEK